MWRTRVACACLREYQSHNLSRFVWELSPTKLVKPECDAAVDVVFSGSGSVVCTATGWPSHKSTFGRFWASIPLWRRQLTAVPTSMPLPGALLRPVSALICASDYIFLCASHNVSNYLAQARRACVPAPVMPCSSCRRTATCSTTRTRSAAAGVQITLSAKTTSATVRVTRCWRPLTAIQARSCRLCSAPRPARAAGVATAADRAQHSTSALRRTSWCCRRR